MRGVDEESAKRGEEGIHEEGSEGADEEGNDGGVNIDKDR